MFKDVPIPNHTLKSLAFTLVPSDPWRRQIELQTLNKLPEKDNEIIQENLHKLHIYVALVISEYVFACLRTNCSVRR